MAYEDDLLDEFGDEDLEDLLEGEEGIDEDLFYEEFGEEGFGEDEFEFGDTLEEIDIEGMIDQEMGDEDEFLGIGKRLARGALARRIRGILRGLIRRLPARARRAALRALKTIVRCVVRNVARNPRVLFSKSRLLALAKRCLQRAVRGALGSTARRTRKARAA